MMLALVRGRHSETTPADRGHSSPGRSRRAGIAMAWWGPASAGTGLHKAQSVVRFIPLPASRQHPDIITGRQPPHRSAAAPITCSKLSGSSSCSRPAPRPPGRPAVRAPRRRRHHSRDASLTEASCASHARRRTALLLPARPHQPPATAVSAEDTSRPHHNQRPQQPYGPTAQAVAR